MAWIKLTPDTISLTLVWRLSWTRVDGGMQIRALVVLGLRPSREGFKSVAEFDLLLTVLAYKRESQ